MRPWTPQPMTATRSGRPASLATDGSGEQTADEVALDQGEADDRRDARDERCGGHRAPGRVELAAEFGDGHGDRPEILVPQEQDGEDELVPGREHGQDAGRGDSG